jgi:hypothetical protein
VSVGAVAERVWPVVEVRPAHAAAPLMARR